MTQERKVHNKLDSPRDTSHWIISGTNTFRLGSRKILSSLHDTPFINFGGNRQNVEGGMRQIYEADKGYKLVSRDQSGAEALIVAYLGKPGQNRQLFEYNINPHAFLALHLFTEQFKKKFDEKYINVAINTKIPELGNLPFWKDLISLIKSSDNWPPRERYYFMSKKIRHAASYGMAANKGRMAILEESGGTIVLSKQEFEYYLMFFHKTFPEIHQWQSKTYEQVKKHKELRNLFGHPFKFTGYIDDDDIRDAYAFVPQSTVATATNIAITETQEIIEKEKLDYHILNNGHDSILAQAPDNDKDIKYCSLLLKNGLEREYISPIDKCKFRMRSSLKVGYNWANYDPDNPEINPNGLKEIND